MRRAMIWIGALLSPVVFAVVLLAGAWWARGELAARALAWQIQDLGLPARFEEPIEIGLGALVLRDLRIGAPEASHPDLYVERLEVHYDWATLSEARATELVVAGLTLRASLDDEGNLSLGSLDGLFGDGGDETRTTPVLPLKRIHLEGAEGVLVAPFGVASVTLNGDLEQAPDGDLHAELKLDATHPQASGSAEIEASGSLEAWRGRGVLRLALLPAPLALESGLEISFDARGEGTEIALELHGHDGAITVPDAGLRFARVEAELLRGAKTLTGTIRVGRLSDLGAEPRFAPVALSARIEGPADASSPFSLRARLRGEGGHLDVDARGTLDPTDRSADLAVTLAPLRFAEQALQPESLLPALAGAFWDVAGAMRAKGRVRLRPDAEIRAEFDVDFEDLSLTLSLGRVEGLNGTVRVLGPEPLRTPPGQELTMTRVDVGVELSEGSVRFQVHSPERAAIAEASFRFAGGTLTTSDVDFDLAAPVNRATLHAENIDLARVLAMVDLEGLSGEGRLSGELPLELRGETIRVIGGRLEAISKGRIVYQPSQVVGAVAAQQEELSLTLQVLEDFHYEELSVDLDGDTRGVMKLTLRTLGSNPNFQDGHAVQLNLNLDIQLSDLVRTGQAVYRLPDKIQERIQRLENP